MRSRPEWIGKSDDHWPPPQWVYEAKYDEFGGKCAVCGRLLRHGHWDLDHTKRVRDGGVNAERNLRPVCRVPCHRDKTTAENKAGAKGAKLKARHHGYKKKKRSVLAERYAWAKARGWKPPWSR